jgi:hypothetical protein
MKNDKEFPAYPPVIFIRITEKLRAFFLRLNRKFTHPNVALWEMVHNFWLAAGIGVAAELGIADLLKKGPVSVEELAVRTGTHKESLYRVLRMLSAHGIFRELRGMRFISTPLAKPLREDQIKYLILLHLTPRHFQMFGELLTSVKTGKNVSGTLEGSALFEHVGKDEQRNARFNMAMTNASKMQASILLYAYSFKRYSKIIDIGGGQGLFLAAILQHLPQSKGSLFDLPQAVTRAGEVIEEYCLGDRMEAIAGDFFKEVPRGGDLYIMKSVLHDWDDDAAAKILGNVKKAMQSTSRLLIIDSVINKRNKPSFGKMTDILMMVSAGGKERTRAEFETLLNRTGFRIRKIYSTISPHSLIEAEIHP